MSAAPSLSTTSSVPSLDVSFPLVPDVLGVSPHGILAAVGILLGVWLLFRRLRARDVPVEPVESALMWGVPAGIVGARLDYLISHPSQFTSVGQALALWNGGLALFGGLLGGGLVGVLILRRRHSPVLAVLDAAAPSTALAIAVGRFGDLLLGDHLGRPTESRYALSFLIKEGYRLAPGFGPSPAVPPGPGESCADLGRYYAGCGYHLSAGYDLVGAAVLTILLVLLARRRPPAGTLSATFGLWYGTQRLLLDFTRGIDERPALGLTGTQWLAIGVIAASALGLATVRRRARHRHGAGPEEPVAAADSGA